jgi:hypothetical protein
MWNSVVLATSALLAACASGNSGTPVAEEQIVCIQDAMQCPDGAWVGRSGPRCAFVCPPAQAK